MSAIEWLKRVARLPLDVALGSAWVRRRLVFEVRQRYFHELECNVSLGHDLVCPIYRWEAWGSFSYIFFQREYAKAFESMPLPVRWIDIGCHAGFFSVFTLWLRAQGGLGDDCRALLIDADSRSRAPVERLIALNHLEGRFIFRRGVISARAGPRPFVEREFGTAAIAEPGPLAEPATLVAPITPADILSLMPPPYDLIKVDIEGGEYEFLEGYGDVLRHTVHLLLEWHSWHPGGGGLPQLEEMLAGHGFELAEDVLAPAAAPHRRGGRPSGVRLYRRRVRAGAPA
jgi:FkbM family methyltransferase